MKAVLFDAGDTLFRVRGSVGEVYESVAARHGVAVDPREMEQRFRTVLRSGPPLSFPDAPEDELPQREYAWWRNLTTNVFAGCRFGDFDAFFRDLFDSFARAEVWELFPDTQPALAALRARGLRLGIVSNFDGRLLGICEGLGIAGAFEAIVMSGRAGYAKPDPRIFAAALTRLGVSAAEAVHVGDSERDDLHGAQAAGVRAILIQRDASAGAPEHVRDLRELIDRL